MSFVGAWRYVTCPVCETVLRMEIPEQAADGSERYELPPHVPWLGVIACLALQVVVTIGPMRRPMPTKDTPLRPCEPRDQDPRIRRS